MSEIVTRKLILTGGRAGRTCVCGKYKFTDGVLVLRGPVNVLDKVTTYLSRTYKAFPEGSAELEEHGERQVQAAPGESGALPVPSGVQSRGSRVAPVPADERQRGDDASSRGTGSVPGGDGHADTRDDGSAGQREKVTQAVNQLDKKNDEHWTVDGRPRIDAVAALVGRPDLTRAEVEAAAPGFKRDGGNDG